MTGNKERRYCYYKLYLKKETQKDLSYATLVLRSHQLGFKTNLALMFNVLLDARGRSTSFEEISSLLLQIMFDTLNHQKEKANQTLASRE